MQSQMIAVVLCVFATTAGAQNISGPEAPPQLQRAESVKSSSVSPAAGSDALAARPIAAPNARPGIITAAGATTPDGPVRVRDNTPVSRAPIGAPVDGEPAQQRGSTAMVLAALALMSGIALRRFGSTGR